MVKQYAPLIYLDKDEEFYPASVEYFFKYVNNDFSQPRFDTKEKINCPSCTNLPFFRGQAVTDNQVPIYAHIVPKPKIGKDITDVIYWMFYPYNRGKRVCISPIYINGNCWGKYSTFGHHVGDWEHVTIRFKKSEPIKIYLSQHADGEVYDWGDYRLRLYTNENSITATHPVVYSAKGSHGLYATSGNHIYRKIFNGDHLTDITSQGDAWKSWNNVKIFEWAPVGQYNEKYAWLNYQGRWGNYKDGCTFLGINFENLFKSCILNTGPATPSARGYADPYQSCEADEFKEHLSDNERRRACS